MDRPAPRTYEVLKLFLEIWERKKGEQTGKLAHPPSTASNGEMDVQEQFKVSGIRQEPGDCAPIYRPDQ
jgi:hypothetical protein